MENEKSLDFKGFGKHSPKANKKKRKKQRRKITRIVEHVDQVTAQKKSVPQALEKFQKLVDEGESAKLVAYFQQYGICLLYTSPSPRDKRQSRMPSSA